MTTCPSLTDVIAGLPSGLENPPTYYPDGIVNYEEKVTMFCVVDGGTNVTRERQCLYDFASQEYALLGDAIDCPGWRPQAHTLN